MGSKVFDLNQGRYIAYYSCSANEACVCAHEQNVNKNFNTWDYDYSQARELKSGAYFCGDYVAREETKCDSCIYHNGSGGCWSIKGKCDPLNIKCDYRIK